MNYLVFVPFCFCVPLTCLNCKIKCYRYHGQDIRFAGYNSNTEASWGQARSGGDLTNSSEQHSEARNVHSHDIADDRSRTEKENHWFKVHPEQCFLMLWPFNTHIIICCGDPSHSCYFRTVILIMLWIIMKLYDVRDVWYATPVKVSFNLPKGVINFIGWETLN